MSAPSVQILLPTELTPLQQQALYVWLQTIGSWVEVRRPFARRNQRYAERVRDRRELLQLRLQLWRDETQDAALADGIHNLNQTVQKQLHEYWEVGVTGGTQFDTEPITNAVRKFGVDLQAFEPLRWEHDDTSTRELRNLLNKIGSVPRQRIEVLGFSEEMIDHVLAGYMAADLAQQFNGWVCLSVRPLLHTVRAEQAWEIEDTRDLVASLDGISHEIIYGTRRDGSPRLYHIGDTDFTRAWVQHPRYWLH